MCKYLLQCLYVNTLRHVTLKWLKTSTIIYIKYYYIYLWLAMYIHMYLFLSFSVLSIFSFHCISRCFYQILHWTNNYIREVREHNGKPKQPIAFVLQNYEVAKVIYEKGCIQAGEEWVERNLLAIVTGAVTTAFAQV